MHLTLLAGLLNVFVDAAFCLTLAVTVAAPPERLVSGHGLDGKNSKGGHGVIMLPRTVLRFSDTIQRWIRQNLILVCI